MTNKDKDYVRSVIEAEGFDYAFRHYSTFDKINNGPFHKLRRAYVEAAKNLADFLEVD